jgi:hypothetical protein
MVWVIVWFVVLSFVIESKDVISSAHTATLQAATEKIVLPVSPFGQIGLHPATLFGRGRTLPPETHWIDAFPIDR